MKPLSIVAYFDGRPGHEKQTRAVLQTLADITNTTVVDQTVAGSQLTYCKNWLTYLMPFLQNHKTVNVQKPCDLIIGSGSQTHLPMLIQKRTQLKKHGRQVRVVTCMSPEPFLLSRFDLCCIPVHDDVAAHDNVFFTLGPPSPVISQNKHNPDRGLILVGGLDRKSHKWNSRAVVEQIKTIIEENSTMKWVVSSSPRTPEDTCQKLEQMASDLKHVGFFRYEKTPAGWVEEQYALHGVVWVTADSISMVYEALNAGCSVGVLPVEWLKAENKFQKSLDILLERKMIVEFSQWQNSAKMPDPSLEPLNEAVRCAREILQRWWPKRLTSEAKH